MTGVLKKPFVVPGLLVVGVVLWAVATRGGAIVNGHPSYWALYGGAFTSGLAAILVGTVRRSQPWRPLTALPAAGGLVVVAGLAWWAAPFAPSPPALLALHSDDRVTVTSALNRIEMSPVGGRTGLGLVFHPGARVDARAYAGILRPIAEAGHEVVIVKQPLGIAFFARGFAPSWSEEHPEIGRWAVGGHSLGGVVASENAADENELDDLVLWASFPATDISERTGLRTVSIFGTNDGLTTPEEVDASKADLPEGTSFLPVEGAIHSHFGDYGLQPGDGEPGIPRAEAQEMIIDGTLAFLTP